MESGAVRRSRSLTSSSDTSSVSSENLRQTPRTTAAGASARSVSPSLGLSPTTKLKKKASVTVPKPFNFTLRSRGEDRLRYNSELKTKQEEQEKVVRERMERRESEEKEARKELWKKQRFKANKVRSFKSTCLQPSTKALTIPVTPFLRTSMLEDMRRAREEERREWEGEEGEREMREKEEEKEESDGPHLSNLQRNGNLDTSREEINNDNKSDHNQLCKESNDEKTTLMCDVTAMVAYYVLVYYSVYLLCS